MLTNCSDLGNAKLVTPLIDIAIQFIRMHIVFSIDMPFLAPQNSFHPKIIELHVMESCVPGFHVYQDILTPTTGEHLLCQMEDSNVFDPYAVAIRKSGNVIGYIPRKISAACIIIDSCCQYYRHYVNTDDNNNYYMKITLAKFKFGDLVMICQFTKFSFPPKFVVMRYIDWF